MTEFSLAWFKFLVAFCTTVCILWNFDEHFSGNYVNYYVWPSYSLPSIVVNKVFEIMDMKTSMHGDFPLQAWFKTYVSTIQCSI